QQPGGIERSLAANVTTYTAVNLQPSTKYTFTLTAEGPYGTTGELTAMADTAANVPGTAALTVTPLAGGKAELNWDAAEEAEITGYRVERRLHAQTDWTVLGDVPRPTTTFDDSDLLACTTYVYRIVALYALESPQVYTVEVEILTAALNFNNFF